MRTLTLIIALSLVSSSALAQDIATEELEKKALVEAKKDDNKKEPPDGWKIKGTVGLTGSYTQTSNLVGAPEDGSTLQFGMVLAANADWKSGQHGWENELKAQQTYSRTPALPVLIKSADQLDLKSTYLFRFVSPDWLGVFGRFKLNTQVLRTNSVQGDGTIYVTQEQHDEASPAVRGDSGDYAAPQAGYRLSGPFEPLTLRESAGAFAKPITEDKITLKVGLGIAAQHLIVRDAKTIVGPGTNDFTATAATDGRPRNVSIPSIIYKPVESTNDFGLELTADANGIIVKDLLTWKAALDLFQPFLPSDENLSGLDRLNAEITGALSLKLLKWLSVDYNLLLRRQPQVIEEWQVQNQIILSAGFDIL